MMVLETEQDPIQVPLDCLSPLLTTTKREGRRDFRQHFKIRSTSTGNDRGERILSAGARLPSGCRPTKLNPHKSSAPIAEAEKMCFAWWIASSRHWNDCSKWRQKHLETHRCVPQGLPSYTVAAHIPFWAYDTRATIENATTSAISSSNQAIPCDSTTLNAIQSTMAFCLSVMYL